jgi:hypothetical protein
MRRIVTPMSPTDSDAQSRIDMLQIDGPGNGVGVVGFGGDGY